MSATVPQTELVDGDDRRRRGARSQGDAARRGRQDDPTDIPVYCYHEKLGPAGLCRICLVEIEGMPKLQIACNTPVADRDEGAHARTPRVDDGRRAILEFFLLNHPLDCPICDKGGECDLQDYAMAWGQGASRMLEPKTPKPKAVDLGPTIVLDEERCIVCQRCVRFDEIITREQSLRTDDRGAHVIIATATGKPYVVGLHRQRHRAVPGRRADLEDVPLPVAAVGQPPHDDDLHAVRVGCQMHVDERGDTLLRTMSVDRRRRDLRHVAVRPRPLQHRLRRATSGG